MAEERYIPATHVEPPPLGGWSAADLSEDELIDDDFIAQDCAKVYPPLAPEDEVIFRA